MIELSDLYIGDFKTSQGFGMNPSYYAWIHDINGVPIRGHNGTDVGAPTGSILLNPFPKDHDVIVSSVKWSAELKGAEPNGLGNSVRIWDKTQGFVIVYGHLKTIEVKEGDKLYFQQGVAHTNNTGWSSGPHVHVGGYFVDHDGVRLNRTNGFDGYINVMDPTLIHFTISNPSEPALPSKPENPSTMVLDQTITQLEHNSDNYRDVLAYLKVSKDFNQVSAGEAIELIKDIERDKETANARADEFWQQVQVTKEQDGKLYSELEDKFFALQKQLAEVQPVPPPQPPENPPNSPVIGPVGFLPSDQPFITKVIEFFTKLRA